MNQEIPKGHCVPELFKEIMRLHDEIDEVKERMVNSITGHVVPWAEVQMRTQELQPLQDRMKELRTAAQKALSREPPWSNGRPTSMRVADGS